MSENMSENIKKQLIDNLLDSQNRLCTLLESVADNQDWQPGPAEWSFRYIAAHLSTVDRDCYRDRVIRISAGENPFFEAYFNTGWDFSQFDLSDSLQEWKSTRKEIFALVTALPAEKLLLTGTHATEGKITVLDVLRMMSDHDQEHIQELQAMLGEYRKKVQS
jgi:hypothetical protein